MSGVEAAWHELISGRRRGPGAAAARAGLRLLSLPYAAGISGYRALFDLGAIHPRRLPCPVVSLGNITVGGTGKTTAARWLVRRLLEWGRSPAVLSRGYRAAAVGPRDVAVVADREAVRLDAAAGGDEPVLLARSLPGVPVLVGKRRVASAERALREFAPDVLVLDDAFQYWRLAKDVEIVLLDAANPFGHGAVFPRGQLREPLRGLRRAHAAILTHAAWADAGGRAAVRTRLERLLPAGAPIAEARHRAVALRDHVTGGSIPLGALAPARGWVAFSGLGRPDSFLRTLREAGAGDLTARLFPDHHRYTAADLAELSASAAGGAGLLTTEKDAVKIAPEWLGGRRLLVLEVDLEFLHGREELEALVRSRLEAAR